MRPARFGPFGYPFGGEARERPLVACWILAMVAFLVPVAGLVAVVPVMGYLVRVLDASAAGESAPRMAVEAVDLVRRGIGGFLVGACYLVGPLVALLVTVYGVTNNDPSVDPVGIVSLYAGSTVVLCLFLLAAFLVPAAVAAYAESESLRAAFSTARLRPVAGHAAYFTRWMAGAVTLTTVTAVANVSLQIHRAGPVVASLLAVYGSIVAIHLWGEGIELARTRTR